MKLNCSIDHDLLTLKCSSEIASSHKLSLVKSND